MKSEKRMVGDYTVLCAVNIGSREIILAENEQDKNGERFLCCYGERNDIFQRYSDRNADLQFDGRALHHSAILAVQHPCSEQLAAL